MKKKKKRMKETGIVRRIDDLGRVVIPKELRRTMGVGAGDPVEMFTAGNRVILQKYFSDYDCIFCGSKDIKVADIHGKYICRICTTAIVNASEK